MKLTGKLAVWALSLPLSAVPIAWAVQNQQGPPTSGQAAPAISPESSTPQPAGQKEPAKFVSGNDPSYTESAREKNIEGTVILAVTVNERGKVTSVKVTNSLESSLDKRAAKAVKHWKFAPATLDGKPVPSEFNVSVDFRLNR